MPDTCDRVHKLIAERRAGKVSLRQFKTQIASFSNEELACLAATLLEATPARRKRLQSSLLASVSSRGRLPALQTAGLVWLD